MNGAESLLRTAAAAGVRVCFANPGTTELPLVAALERVREIRPVLGLFEGVCTGAADGYARMTGQPALTLLHMGPGLANGTANLHNARRARVPMVNVIGDHATWHRDAEAPLTMDIEGLARTVSDWVRTSHSADELPGDMTAALAAAVTGQVATLIVPHDVQLQPAGAPAPLPPLPKRSFDPVAVKAAAELLRRDQPTALLLGGAALSEPGLRAAGRIAAATACQLLCETFPTRLERGGDLPAVERLPYFPERVLEALRKFRAVVLAGAKAPVAFFGYAGQPSRLLDSSMERVTLATPTDDVPAALDALADTFGKPAARATATPAPARPTTGALSAETIGTAVAALQPEGAIVVDEGITGAAAYFQLSAGALRHSYLTLTGGAIGYGPPCATGAAVACPGRQVISLQADGSAFYTLQALWTQARERLDVITLLFANKKYRILGIEAARAAEKGFDPATCKLFDLGDPAADWVNIATGLGVEAARVENADQLVDALRRALAARGPHLIEVVL